MNVFEKLKIDNNKKTIVLNNNHFNGFDNTQVTLSYPTEPAENIVLFVKNTEELKNEVFKIIDNKSIVVNGKLFIAYPKKGNTLFNTFISRDEIHPILEMDTERFAKGSDFKFNQLISLDDNYSIMILKRVLKEKIKKIDKSGRVDTYIEKIGELEKKLKNHESAYAFFINLTTGYKKTWARYIYSAKLETTQENRFNEVIELLQKGIKTK